MNHQEKTQGLQGVLLFRWRGDGETPGPVQFVGVRGVDADAKREARALAEKGWTVAVVEGRLFRPE